MPIFNGTHKCPRGLKYHGIRRRGSGRYIKYGMDRLHDVVREWAARSADEIVQSVRERLTAFRGDVKSVDVVTFVVVKVLPVESGTTK
jgi:hypothetical protein